MIAWLAGNMIWASAAMLVVLVIRRPVAAMLGAGTAYALWLVPAVRLVGPPADWFAGSLATLPPIILSVDMAEGGTAGPAAGVAWLDVLSALWLAGALLFLAYHAVCYRRFLRRLSLSLQSAGRHGGLPLLASGAVEGPLALGLVDRRIVVPADFESRYAPAERRLALDHERYHHRRGDILANHVALLVLALNWFNPVAWLAFRAFRADQELSCDAAVAASAPAEARADYARALVKSASKPGLIAACPLNHADQLKRRLKMLKHHRKDRGRALAGAAVSAALVAASMAFGAPGLAQDKAEEKQERRIIIMEHRDGAGGHGAEHREHRRDGEGHAIRRHLDPEVAARIERCREGNNLLNVDEGEGNQRTRIVLCNQGEGSAESRVEALERARERLASEGHLSAETRQRVLAQIDQAIARARAGN
ncbi:M56 family metallopeptidase [Sphingosinicella sp. YJ22]|uniref:M56 family metallopeptidase n=1 Tax=Sphingosinicella sp. YJ22 TaxID=1104780 RepID=UPI00140B4D92|nr:M56 family metallopeptidase [Sphingosinicella sp. YJ22]